ncbi:MAG: CPBP family intramembrane metalloprotease [Candidatus Neomarinimicrobiota bacterium]|nr:MAG: CPBP family intramembrane metalloprotease [Candidatus Neomarinimicrobiota bacterium]
MRSYWTQSRSLFYSLIAVVPLLVTYEVGLLLIHHPGAPRVRNTADVILNSVLATFGLQGLAGLGLLFLIGILFAFLFFRQRQPDFEFSSQVLLGMLIESLIWGSLLAGLLGSLQTALVTPVPPDTPSQIILGLGAGLFEEFLFRLILISGLTPLIVLIFQTRKLTAALAAIVTAALIFSWFHFLGPMGESVQWNRFLLRWFAGIVLGLLYQFRGFGITAWTHAIYDVVIIVSRTVMS